MLQPQSGRDHAPRRPRRSTIDVVADKDLARARAIVGDAARVTDDAFAVVRDPEIDIVVELIGGYTVAKDLILRGDRATASTW